MKNKQNKLFLLACLIATFLSPWIIKNGFAQTYRKPIPSLPITLDPKKYHDAYSVLVATQIYDRLFDADELLSLKPKLVSSWKNLNNSKTWIINLRTDVFFHNGKQLTANDMAFTIKRLIEKNSLKKHEFSIIEGAEEYREGKKNTVSGIKVLSADAIEITLKEPFPLFLSTFAAPNTEILPANFDGKSEEEFFINPIGTGPFKFDSYSKGNQVQLIANNQYFLGKPKLSVLVFEKADYQKAITGFNTGYYQDVEFYFPKANELTKSFTLIKTPQADTTLFVFNNQKPPFNNYHFRKAVIHAIDKSKLFNLCFSNQIYAKGYIPHGLGGYYPDIDEIKYDLTTAKNELKSANINKSDLAREFVFIRPDNHPCREDFALFITESLKKIGLNVKVMYLTLDVMISRIEKRDYDLFSAIFTADYPEALFMLNLLRGRSPYNPSSTPEYDNLLDKASMTQDRFERYNLYRQAQETLLRNAYVLPICHGVFSSIFQTNVRGATRSPLTFYLSPMNSIYLEGEAGK